MNSMNWLKCYVITSRGFMKSCHKFRKKTERGSSRIKPLLLSSSSIKLLKLAPMSKASSGHSYGFQGDSASRD